MVNKAILQGRLCADPELRHTQSGTAVCSFRVAWSEKYKERENKLFLACSAWGATGETVNNYFRKGQEILVDGRLETRDWNDKEGNKRSSIEMTADKVHFCGPKQTESNYSGPESAFSELDDDGDLPF